MGSRYAALTREELARLVPELLLIGQLIDRSGMAWCIQEFGREGMAQIAIEEWACASPVYTQRMQRALAFEGDDVITIFKGLQLDIGAPPQFMDFRYAVEDPHHGSFALAHCGALLDVEPMGPDYVRAMCHDIEDPTFDATAVATNSRAQVRPVHRPPRTPADRTPHCEWTVVISPDHPPVSAHPGLAQIAASRAAATALDSIETGHPGRAAYDGPLLDDLDFGAFSHPALVRMADEVCLQMHLLVLSFRAAVLRRTTPDREREITTRQLIGIAGVAASRLASLVSRWETQNCPSTNGQGDVALPLGLSETQVRARRVLELHPLFNPAAYVTASTEGPTCEPADGPADESAAGSAVAGLRVAPGPAHEDGAWISLVGPGNERALQVIVQAVDPHLDVQLTGTDDAWTAQVVRRDSPASAADEVAVTRFSLGAGWEFEPRRSLPIWPVQRLGRFQT